MDLNFPSNMFASADSAPKSQLVLNGIGKSNMRYLDWPGQGIVWNPNTANNSVWQVNVTDIKWHEQTIIKLTYPPLKMHANLSTTSPTIVMPVTDFENFGMALRFKEPDFNLNGDTILANKPCSHYNLGNLTISINGLDFRIPQLYYAKTI
jgi:hypothetical protein